MKKMIAILGALVMLFTAATAALAENAGAPTITGGVQFNMDMDQVMQTLNLPHPEMDRDFRGTTEFYELEYEHVTGGDGFTADVKYLFVGNGLVAVHIDLMDGTPYDAVRADLVKTYGEPVPFDAAKIGNGRFAVDDDGDVRNCKEMIELEGLTIVLEQDYDGDVDVTFLDPTAAYINN